MTIFDSNPVEGREVTKSDTAPTYQFSMSYLYCGVGGDICVITEAERARAERAGTPFASIPTVTITMAAGGYLPLQVYAIKSTGTTAGDIIGFYG